MSMQLPGRNPRPLEKAIQKDVLTYLRANGWLATRVNGGGTTMGHGKAQRFVRFHDTPGLSDVIAVKDGRFLAVEVKRPGGKLTPEQSAYLIAVGNHGGLALVVRDVRDLAAALDAEGL